MSRTIVITGATGFIGGVLAKQLRSSDWNIRALVRSASYDKRPKDIKVEWVIGDLENVDSLQQLVAGADAIVHCAGAVRGAVQNDFDRINVDGVAQLVKVAAQQKPAPRFLLISSLAAREPQLSYYAASKLKGEEALATYAKNMFWGVMRPSAVYGPGDREMRPLFQWMLRGIAPLIGPDKNRVSLIYVEDLVNAIVSWLDNAKHPQQVYELHDGHQNGYSWLEIIDTIERLRGSSIFKANIPIPFVGMVASVNLMLAKVFGGSPMLTPGKVRELTHANWVADNNLLSSQTDWAPLTSLEDGLRQTFDPVI
ncbi:MAG: nucleoside-diphosphate-sugar epimerase [Desulforhopalus sp.]|jgi:nucleoside-diphosphate-sugar epimerase